MKIEIGVIRILNDVYLLNYASGKFSEKYHRLHNLISYNYLTRPTPINDIPVVGNGWKPVKALSFQAVGNLR